MSTTPNTTTPNTTTPQPWTLAVPQEDLDDLRRRIESFRWPDSIPGSGYAFGLDPELLRTLVRYWLDEYDWRAQEAQINRDLPSYVADVGGTRVHYARVAGVGPAPMPLLAVHGWPGTYLEFSKVAPLLTDPGAHGGRPEDAFELIIPSIPGHGFSQAPAAEGFGADAAATTLHTLMTDVLGFDRYAAQGGDRGSYVAQGLGHQFPSHIIGMHLNLPWGIPGEGDAFSDEEREWLAHTAAWYEREGAYTVIQGSRPQTLAYALNDSPVGMLAWIVEKWRAWSDCDGDVLSVFSADELITNVMLYWVSGSIRSSMHYYYEHRVRPPVARSDTRIDVATGVQIFPAEISRAPLSAVKRKYDLRSYTVADHGGHFAAMEEPEALVEDIRAFFRPLRAS